MSKTIRCKFEVETIIDGQDSSYKSAVLTPVMEGSEENKKFWEFTPAGRLELSVTNGSLDSLALGQEYYIDISLAE